MQCNKKRFKKTSYCSNDFRFEVELQRQAINPSICGKIDATVNTQSSIKILCHVSINKGEEFITEGSEILQTSTKINITANYFDAVETIRNDNRNWFILYQQRKYQVSSVDYVSQIKRHIRIQGNLVNN